MHSSVNSSVVYNEAPFKPGVVHAWVGRIVTFFATAPLAAPWAP